MMLSACGGGESADPPRADQFLSQFPYPDHVRIHGYRANFTIARTPGETKLTNLLNGEVQSIPGNLHRITFADGVTQFGLDRPEATVYRLYRAAFGRQPDPRGLGFWIEALQRGMPLASIAQSFIDSDEFRGLYGANPTPEQFVTAAYLNILGREPEREGYDWWVRSIRDGASRAEALLGFADSTENVIALIPSMENGYDYIVERKEGEPIVPARNSYLNKNNPLFRQTAMPGTWDAAMSRIKLAQDADPSLLGFASRSLSLGDFFRNGTISMFVASPRFTGAYPNDNPNRLADSPALVYFLRMGSDGKWVDDTAKVIPDPDDRLTCITPSYSIVADFNSDGAPDVYIACTGVDFMVGGRWTDDQTSDQHLYLSQLGGTFRHVTLPIGKVYGHQATAADFNGDGHVDIVSVDPVIRKTPFVLWGKGDGTFTEDRTIMPADTHGKDIYGAVAVPVEGKLNLVLSGLTPGAWTGSNPYFDSVAYGTKVLTYQDAKFEMLRDLTPAIPVMADGRKYSSALDHIYHEGSLYSLRSNFDYSAQAITKTDWATGETIVLWSVEPLGPGIGFDQFALLDGFFVQFGAMCNRENPPSQLACSYRIKP